MSEDLSKLQILPEKHFDVFPTSGRIEELLKIAASTTKDGAPTPMARAVRDALAIAAHACVQRDEAIRTLEMERSFGLMIREVASVTAATVLGVGKAKRT